MLFNRETEKRALAGVLSRVREGLSGALVVRGEPGIGKTALLEYAVVSAVDMQVARVTGVESEMALAYAASHQLLVPLLKRVDRLPEPQRLALCRRSG